MLDRVLDIDGNIMLTVAKNPEVLDILDSVQVGLIFRDIHIPMINVRELLRHIQARPKNARLLFLIMTARCVGAIVLESIRYIFKPFRINELLPLLQHY